MFLSFFEVLNKIFKYFHKKSSAQKKIYESFCLEITQIMLISTTNERTLETST